MVAFVLLIALSRGDTSELRAVTIEREDINMPQIIAESRAVGVNGFSRWRVGDNVQYVSHPGFGISIIDRRNGDIAWQGAVRDDNIDEARNLGRYLALCPDDVLVVITGHWLTPRFLSKELETLLKDLGGRQIEKGFDKSGYVLISERKGGRFERVAEQVGDHLIVAVNPNIVMRAYFLFRIALPAINVLALYVILILLVAAFTRANHSVSWPDSFRYALIGAPILGALLLGLVRYRPLFVSAMGLMITIGAYILYREAFSYRRPWLYKTLIVLLAIVAFSNQLFLGKNYSFVSLLVMSAAVYLICKTYSHLFGSTRCVSFPLLVFFATRIPLAAVAYISRLYLHGGPKSLRELLVHWDAAYYLGIASEGYHLRLADWSPAPFFPLFPFIIRTFNLIWDDITVAGALVANLAFLISLILLYLLARRRWGESVAERSVFLMALGPASFFFLVGYTESLFLLCCLACFTFVLDRKWLWAGVLGGLATITRSLGLILCAVAAWEYLKSIDYRPFRIRASVAWLMLIPLCLGLFVFVQYGSTGDMFANVTAQKVWGRQPMQKPISVLVRDWGGS